MRHNLLPKDMRKKLRTEYYLRALNVSLLLFSVVLALGAVALIPPYFRVTTELSGVTALLEYETAQRAEESATAPEDFLAKTKSTITALQEKLDHPPFTDIVTTTLVVRPEGIALTGLSFDRKNNAFVVEGTAATRDALVVYKDALTRVPGIGNVTSPISNLAKNTNLPFQISFTFAKPT